MVLLFLDRFSLTAFIKLLIFGCFFQFWYFTYGTKDVLERECKDLHTKLKVCYALHSAHQEM